MHLTKRAYQSANFVKFRATSQKCEFLHFDGIKFQLKKYRTVISHDTEEVAKFKEKMACGFKYNMRNL